MSRVLVPIDFSVFAHAAFDTALGLVEGCADSSITLLHVVEPLHEPDFASVDGPREKDLAARINHADAEMMRLRELHQKVAEIHTRVLVGDPARIICRVAADEGFELMVVSSHGQTGLARALMGSVIERIVQVAPCPVLVVKPMKTEDGQLIPFPAPTLFDCILVGYDHRPCCAHALHLAKELAKPSGHQLLLVQAIQGSPLGDTVETGGIHEARDRARVCEALQALHEVRSSYWPESANWKIMAEIGASSQVMLEVAKKYGCNLIVIGPHEYGRWGHGFSGSTAERIVQLAPCPVMLVK